VDIFTIHHTPGCVLWGKIYYITFRYIRGAQAVHSAQCAMKCAAVPCTRARDGTARHVADEGMAASAIGGEGERTLSERDR
jgi:hypothetical protein